MEQRALHSAAARGRAVGDFVAAATLVALLVSAILGLAVAIVPAAEPISAGPTTGAVAPLPDSAASALVVPDPYAVIDDPQVTFQLEIGNRMYPDWKETQEVHLQQEFPIGDTENSGKVVRFLPSFLIDHGKPHSVSARMDNPAVRILVYFKGAPKDSAWAFLNFPPHFSPKSFYTFQLQGVQGYTGGSASAAPDSKAAATPAAAPADTHPAAAQAPAAAGKVR